MSLVGAVQEQLASGRCLIELLPSFQDDLQPGDYVILRPSGKPAVFALVESIHGKQDAGSAAYVLTCIPAKGFTVQRVVGAEAHVPTAAELEAYATAKGALSLGELLRENEHVGVRVPTARIAENHSCIFGLSGTGKTTLLGVVLEQLLLNDPEINIVVIDPNSDFSRFDTPRHPAVVNAVGDCAKLAEGDVKAAQQKILAAGIRLHGKPSVRLNHYTASELLDAIGHDLSPAATFVLEDLWHDWLTNDTTITGTVLQQAVDRLVSDVMGERRGARYISDETIRSAALELRLLADRLQGQAMWSHTRATDVTADLDDRTRRFVQFDVSKLAADQRCLLSIAVLRRLWSRNIDAKTRRPTLIVIDEAHNIVPAAPLTRVHRECAEYVNRIAAEGRKFALRLLLVSQRPAKIHPDALDNTRNTMLLRLQNRDDIDALNRRAADVPATILGRVPLLPNHSCVVYGALGPTFLVRNGRRLMEEFG